MNQISTESNKMKQNKLNKMITSGEKMEEKRENMEKELLEELLKSIKDKVDIDTEFTIEANNVTIKDNINIKQMFILMVQKNSALIIAKNNKSM